MPDSHATVAAEVHRSERLLGARPITHEHDEGNRVAELAHEAAVLLTKALERRRRDRWQEARAFDPEAVAVGVTPNELVAHGGLWNARNRVRLLRVATHDTGRWVQS